MVEQRLAGADVHAFDFADEQGVIARRIFRGNIAGEMSEGVMDQWNTGRGPEESNAKGFGELRVPARGFAKCSETTC